MHGTETWRKDFAKIGPKKATCADHSSKEPIVDVDYQSKQRMEEGISLSHSQIAIQESISLLPLVSDEKPTAVVFCGVQYDGGCGSFEAISAKIRTFVLWTCPANSSDENNSNIDNNLDFDGDNTLCGMEIDRVLRSITSKLGRLHLIVIDDTVPPPIVIDVANALTRVPLHSNDSLVSDNALFILPKLRHLSGYFLEICRLNLFDDLLRLAVVSIDQISNAEESNNDANQNIMMGYITIGNPWFLPQLVNVMDNISQLTSGDVVASLVEMRSNPVQFQSSYSPHQYTMHDYDEAPGMKQYSEQMPLGKQSILQMKFADATISITKELLETRARSLLMGMNAADVNLASRKISDGIVTYGVFGDGHMVAVWDGRQQIDVNIFTYNETSPHKSLFEEHFMKAIHISELTTTTLTLWEEQPRGVGNVVNFQKDILALPGCVDRFVVCDKLEELRECERESEVVWMSANCPLVCGKCVGVSDV